MGLHGQLLLELLREPLPEDGVGHAPHWLLKLLGNAPPLSLDQHKDLALVARAEIAQERFRPARVVDERLAVASGQLA